MNKTIIFILSLFIMLGTNVLAAEKEEVKIEKDYSIGLVLRKSFIKLSQFSGELRKEGLEEFSDNPNLIGVTFSFSKEGFIRLFAYSGNEIKEEADGSENASFKIDYSLISLEFAKPLKRFSKNNISSEFRHSWGLGWGDAEFEIKKVTNDANYPWQYRKITNTFFVFEPQVSLNIAYIEKPIFIIPNQLEFAISYFMPFAVSTNREGDFTTLSGDKMDLKHFASEIRFVWKEF